MLALPACSCCVPLTCGLCVQQRTLTPILWDDKFRSKELLGSPVLAEARTREAALREEWASVSAALDAAQSGGQLADGFPRAAFTEAAFLDAVSVVLAHAIYLESVGCFALLPVVSMMRRTGNGDGCDVDFDTGAFLTSPHLCGDDPD